MNSKSQGHPPTTTTTNGPYSFSASRKLTASTNTDAGHRARMSGSNEKLLSKRYRLGSVPVAASIDVTSSGHGRRLSAVHTSSPSSTRRSYRKIRKGYAPAITSTNGVSHTNTSRRRASGVVGGASHRDGQRSHCGQSSSANFTLPRVGQRSNERSGKESLSVWMRKPSEQSHTHFETTPRLRQRVDDFEIVNTRFCRTNDARLSRQLRKSLSVGARLGGVVVGKCGCGVGRRWREGECCCEDEGEESGTSILGDPINIEGIYTAI